RIGARIRVNRVRADEVRAGEVVPEMAVHGVDEKKFAVLVPIVAPRIRGASAQYFYGPALRMVAPDRAAQRNALFGRLPRYTDLARARRATAPLEPAVRTESQAGGKGVVHIGRASEAVEHNFRRAVRHIVPVAIRDKQQSRRTHHPHATV